MINLDPNTDESYIFLRHLFFILGEWVSAYMHCMYVWACMHSCMCAWYPWRSVEILYSWSCRQLWATMRVLGSKPRSYARITSALSHWTVHPFSPVMSQDLFSLSSFLFAGGLLPSYFKHMFTSFLLNIFLFVYFCWWSFKAHLQTQQLEGWSRRVWSLRPALDICSDPQANLG